MDETEFYRSGTYLVTSTRVEIDGQTFALRNIGSVKVTMPGTPWLAGFFLLVFGMAAYSATDSGTKAGLATVAAGCLAWMIQKARTHRLVIVGGGGETVALSSTNAQLVHQLRDAIAQAISGR